MKRRTLLAAAASAALLPFAARAQARFPQRSITLYGALPSTRRPTDTRLRR
jgi:hypothetical protein